MAHIQASINKILDESGTLLMSVWSETGDLVPNYSVHTAELNNAIREYQAQLDELDLEIQRWLASKKATTVTAKQESNGATKREPEPNAGVNDQPMEEDLGFGEFLNDSNMDYLF